MASMPTLISLFFNGEQKEHVCVCVCHRGHATGISILSGKQDAVNRMPSDYWLRGSTLTLICTMNSAAHFELPLQEALLFPVQVFCEADGLLGKHEQM